LLGTEIERWKAVDPALVDPLLALRDFVAAGGKRLRPAFCACAYVGAGGAIDDPAVIDARRPRSSSYTPSRSCTTTSWTAPISGAAVTRCTVGSHGNTKMPRGGVHARRFGDGMAILVGDFALVYADILLRRRARRRADDLRRSSGLNCASASRSTS